MRIDAGIEVVALVLGVVLLLIALVGGGLEVKGLLTLPRLPLIARLLTGATGLIFAVLAFVIEPGAGEGGEKLAREQYQDQVRSICDRDRVQWHDFESRIDGLELRINSGEVKALDDYTALMEEIVRSETSLKLDLEALNPPTELRGQHTIAVDVWNRLVSFHRSYRDDLRNAPDIETRVHLLVVFDRSEEERLAEQLNLQLRKLSGSGCAPAF